MNAIASAQMARLLYSTGGESPDRRQSERKLKRLVDEIYARLSKEQRILCGRQDATGRYVCDEPLAAYVKNEGPFGSFGRYLVPLDGWTQDRRKGIWQQTTSVEDRRKHGIPRPDRRVYPLLPALARCPKCRAVQWLDPGRLRITPGPNTQL